MIKVIKFLEVISTDLLCSAEPKMDMKDSKIHIQFYQNNFDFDFKNEFQEQT